MSIEDKVLTALLAKRLNNFSLFCASVAALSKVLKVGQLGREVVLLLLRDLDWVLLLPLVHRVEGVALQLFALHEARALKVDVFAGLHVCEELVHAVAILLYEDFVLFPHCWLSFKL